jgi:high affinity sulfate transporter 1
MNGPAPRRTLTAIVPALDWLPGWRGTIRRDVVAALAVWAVLVPQSMAYAVLAGVPPVHGLYAAVAGLAAYALLGTSRQLSVGPSSGVAVLSAATVAPLAAGDPALFLALSGALALLTGVVLVVAGLLRLGFVAEFLARPVLTGYVIGLGLVIVVGQLPALLGITVDGSGFFAKAGGVLRALPDLDPATAALGVGTLAFLLALKALAPRAPGALIAVVAGVLLSRALDLGAEGVALLGSFEAAFPELGLPNVEGDDLQRLATGAAGLALLCYAESIAAARALAAKHGYHVDPNRELVAVGATNLAAGVSQGFAIDASMSRTTVADGAGQRSQLAGLLNVVLVVASIVLLAGFFADLPVASLAAIVIAAVLPLLRTGELRRLRAIDDVDYALAAICLFGVLTLGVLDGIVVAVVASLIALVVRSYRPRTAVLGRVPGDGEHDEGFGFRDIAQHAGLETFPGLVMFRFDQEIFFANASLFRDALLRAVDGTAGPVTDVLVDAAAVTHVDTTGLDMLDELLDELTSRGVRLRLARVKTPVREALERSGLLERLGEGAVTASMRTGLDALRADHRHAQAQTGDGPPRPSGDHRSPEEG